MLIVACLVYLVAHAGAYFAILRAWSVLGSERGVFLYHFSSAIAMSGGLGIWALARGGEAWTWFACAVILHGIYSLSFLELWALADGGYSLAMLHAIDRSGVVSRHELMQMFEATGARKQVSRLESLKRVGLLRESGDGFVALTSVGRAGVYFGSGLLYLVDIRKHG